MEYFTYYVIYQLLVGVLGLEPRISEPKSDVLPLHHTPILYLKLHSSWVSGQVRTDVNRNHNPAPKPLGHRHTLILSAPLSLLGPYAELYKVIYLITRCS